MRVIAGKYRGANLVAPPGKDTRPITDRAKETLFNVLGHKFGLAGVLPDIAVLDLFAGSGSLGIEALSRGAQSCVFVERGRPAINAIRANIRKLRLERVTSVVVENAWTMRVPSVEPDGYGVIFLDPPYRDVADTRRVIDLLERLAPRLAPDGVLVFRHEDRADHSNDQPQMLECGDERVVGTMRIRFFRRASGKPPGAESCSPPAADQ